MLKISNLSRADAYVLYEAGDVADAQMRLVEQVKKRTGAFAPPLSRPTKPAILVNLALMAVASALFISALA